MCSMVAGGGSVDGTEEVDTYEWESAADVVWPFLSHEMYWIYRISSSSLLSQFRSSSLSYIEKLWCVGMLSDQQPRNGIFWENRL